MEKSLRDAWEWVRESTYCPFAQKAHIWIGPNWVTELMPVENLRALDVISRLTEHLRVISEHADTRIRKKNNPYSPGKGFVRVKF